MARSATYLTILGSEPGKLVLPLNLNMLGTTLTLPSPACSSSSRGHQLFLVISVEHWDGRTNRELLDPSYSQGSTHTSWQKWDTSHLEEEGVEETEWVYVAGRDILSSPWKIGSHASQYASNVLSSEDLEAAGTRSDAAPLVGLHHVGWSRGWPGRQSHFLSRMRQKL